MLGREYCRLYLWLKAVCKFGARCRPSLVGDVYWSVSALPLLTASHRPVRSVLVEGGIGIPRGLIASPNRYSGLYRTMGGSLSLHAEKPGSNGHTGGTSEGFDPSSVDSRSSKVRVLPHSRAVVASCR